MRRMLALALAAALSGCGADDESATRITTTSTSSAEEVKGPLTAEGIGEVEVGASEDEVRAAFGEPIDEMEVDLGAAGGRPPQVNWIYRLEEGDVTIKFDTRDGTFAQYDAYTPELETDDGIKVGDSDSDLRKRYGDDLAGSPLGIHALVLSAAKPGTTRSPALTFTIDGTTIMAISGGAVVQPAGE